MNVLQINDLYKSYGSFAAIKGISFHVGKGEIVGFIGPNGSGKTTTLKMIANLIWPDKGEITVCGHDLMKERDKALSCMAGIVENPGLYPNLSGMENLRFIQKLRKVSKQRLDEVIKITGLGGHLKRTVHKYSLGMKQRLALGMCLLTKPQLLILDEPTNGLDPTGTIELREMLGLMSESEDTSILFSSHLLGEVEKLAHRIIYIKEGLIITEQAVTEATGANYIISVADCDREKAANLLGELPDIISVTVQDDGSLRASMPMSTLDNAITRLHEHAITISDITKQSMDLEYVYNEIYRKSGGSGGVV